MLFLGAGGMAAQLFDDLITLKVNDYVFWSETATKYNCIKENFKILQTDIEVKNYFAQTSKLFSAAIWDIDDRKI
ncbi:hypothetical protein [Ferruginibacter sp.]